MLRPSRKPDVEQWHAMLIVQQVKHGPSAMVDQHTPPQ